MKNTLLATALAALCLLPVGFASRLALAQPAPSPSPGASASIGQASMEKNGTIILLLRAQSGSTVGDGRVEYRRDSPHYQDILKHLGGLKPGQSKPCPPW